MADQEQGPGGSLEHRKCEWLRDFLVDKPTIKFMFQAIRKTGCGVGVQDISCVPCAGAAQGGFVPPCFDDGTLPSKIVICENHLGSPEEQERTMVHELVHLFDDCRAKVQWTNLHHHACSEIRASALSGECKFFAEVARGNIGFKKHFQKCVRRRAALSVSQNPECPNNQAARQAVDSVWDTCFSDTQPFARIP